MKGILALTVSSVALVSATPVFAQQQVGAVQPEATPQQAGELGGDDIVVTANRESSLLSKTPIALTAVTGDNLRTAGVVSPTALGEVTPNLAINRDAAPASGGGLQITIRGVTSTDATEKGDPSAAFLRDGIYIARPQAQEVSFFDVERVEVLRGPQGTLYGRNTTAGVVNVLTVRPRDEFGVGGQVSYASFDAIEATGILNLPASDGLAFRLAANHARRDGVVIATVSPTDINPYREATSVRLSALAKPSDRISIFVQGDYSWINGSGFAAVPVTNFFAGPFVANSTPRYVGGGAKRLRSTNRAIPAGQSIGNSDWGVTGELNWDLGFGTLTWLSSYREFDRDEMRQAGPSGSQQAHFTGNFWQNSQELRLAVGRDSWWKAQVGGYYFKERSDLTLVNFATDRAFIQGPTKALGKAAFGQLTLTPLEGLNLTGGIRYSEDEKSRSGVIVADPFGAGTVLQVNDANRSFSKTTWRLGADYDIPGLGLVYATVSTGYKAGGFNDGCLAGTGATCALTADQLYYQPETITSYEAGFKWRLPGDNVRLNGSVFHYDYRGLQLSQASFCSGVNCQLTSNAGVSKIDGVELETVLKPATGHNFNLGLNWLDARYTDFMPVPGVDFAGRPLPRAPKWSWTAGYVFNHDFDNGGRIMASVQTRFSDRYDLTDLATRVHFYQPSFTKTNVTLGYTAPDNRWDVQLFAKNLENAIVLTYARNSATSEATFEEPRSFGVRLGFKY